MQPHNSYDYANPANATDLSTIEALLQLLVDKQQVEFQRELWIDANGLVFVKTVTFDETTGLQTESTVDISGATVTPVMPATPYASGDRELIEVCYKAINTGAGAGSIGWGIGWGAVYGGETGATHYTIGDEIARINIVDPLTGATFQPFWFNKTTGFYIAEPFASDIVLCRELNVLEQNLSPVDLLGNPTGQVLKEVRTYDNGVLVSTEYQDTTTGAVVTLPAGTAQLAPVSGLDKEVVVLYDDGVPFLRHIAYNYGTMPIQTYDTLIDGLTSYAAVSTVTADKVAQNSDFSILSTSGSFTATAATYKSLSFTSISNDCTLNTVLVPAGMTVSMTPSGLVNNTQVFDGTQYTLIGEVLA